LTPERYQQIKRVFAEACRREPAQRVACLDQACGADAELRREVEALLAHDQKTFPVKPGISAAAALGLDHMDVHAREGSSGQAAFRPPTAKVPERIGHYRIIRKIGQGGMGVVFEAEQDHPRRTIALKVIRPGIASEQLLRRFKHEAQVLGCLQHPGIAQVYEAGMAEVETENGLAVEQPFFAMEYVRGEPLNELVGQRDLGTRRRLELFATICDAVQHAHQKGVIHRDLKPANILIDEAGQPKILDFGVARVTDADVQMTTLQTDVGQLIGTLPYMSPEQVAGDSRELDTRSDVYALGVVCFELLTGRLPYDLAAKTIPEAARTIAEEDPTRLSSIDRVFRGDLDTIVSKALEKDKNRRYQSASDLAADIRRYLSDQPIAARPATTLYQLRKFARRNKTLVGAVAVAFALLCGGLIQVTLERNRAVRAERAAELGRTEAERQAAIAQAVNDFLNDDLLAAANPERLGRDVTVRQVLAHAAEAIEGRFKDEPLVEAAIRSTLGETYHRLGEYDSVALHLEKALELRRAELGEDHRATLTSMCDLGFAYGYLGRWDEAEPLCSAALEGRRRVLGDDHPDTLMAMNNLATLYFRQARFDQAEPLLLEALAGLRRVLGEDHPDTLDPMNNLANLYARQDRWQEAEVLMIQTLETRRRVLGAEHPRTLVSMNNLASVYSLQGRYEEAEPLYAQTLEIRRRVLGEEHPRTIGSVGNLGYVYCKQGRFDEAEPLYLRAAEGLRRLLGEDHPQTLLRMSNLAALYHDQGRDEEAEQLYAKVLEARRRVLGEDHTDTLANMQGLVRSLIALGKLEEAEPVAVECYERNHSVHGPDHDETRDAMELLVELYEAWDRPEQAAEWRAKLPATQPVPPDEPPASADE